MSLDADAIVDRRRMRRKLTFWRVTAIVVALVAVAGAAYVLTPRSRLFPAGAYIARIKVQGLIRDNRDRVEALDRLAKSRARAVILHIDSPGGISRLPGTSARPAPTSASTAISPALTRQKVSLRRMRRRSTMASASSDMGFVL